MGLVVARRSKIMIIAPIHFMFELALPCVIDRGSSRMTRNTMHWTSSRWSLGISQCRQTAENCNCCYRTFDFHFCACHERVCCRLPCRILNSWCRRANGTFCPIQQYEYRDEKSNRGTASAAQRVKPFPACRVRTEGAEILRQDLLNQAPSGQRDCEWGQEIG